MSKKEALAAFLAKVSTVPDSVDGPVSFISRTKKWTVKLPRASSSDAAAGGAGSAGAAAVVASEAEAPAPIRLTAELSHTVAVEDCSGPAVVVVAGKPKTVLVDSCRDMVIEIECCVCGVEIVNCANVTIKCSQQLVPSISVDKTTDAHVMLLSDAALAAQIVWCDAKDLRLSFLQPGGASEAALPPGPEGSEASSKATVLLTRGADVDPRRQMRSVVEATVDGTARAVKTEPFELFNDEDYVGKARESGWF